MICQFCYGKVIWAGPLNDLTHTQCLCCGRLNCQVVEEEIEEESGPDATEEDS